jgi:conjugal transfer pilus assembly protein TraU
MTHPLITFLKTRWPPRTSRLRHMRRWWMGLCWALALAVLLLPLSKALVGEQGRAARAAAGARRPGPRADLLPVQASPMRLVAGRTSHETRFKIDRCSSLAVLALAGVAAAPARADTVTCHGKFINPITDVCWSCLFPLSIGGLDLEGFAARSQEPSFPCAPAARQSRASAFRWLLGAGAARRCHQQVGVFPNLGGIRLNPGFDIGHGHVQGRSQIGGKTQNSSQWQSHYYVYPLLYWMEILTDFLCFEQTTFDVAYVTEIDPLWQDSALTSIINPEVALFANPIATAACAADCVAATAKLPIDQMFWCAGCNGSMYPMNGNIAAHVTIQRRGSRRAHAYKMHREALAWGTMGSKASAANT